MKYGQGFWVVENGVRLKDRSRAYPRLQPFEYADGTKDKGWLHLSDFTVDYVRPGDSTAWRITIFGDPDPTEFINSFDYDGASIPPILRPLAADKMAHKWIVASDLHDLGYCVHGHVTGFTKADWDTALMEIGEAYGARALEARKYWAAVEAGGWAAWGKTETEASRYRNLCSFERVPL